MKNSLAPLLLAVIAMSCSPAHASKRKKPRSLALRLNNLTSNTKTFMNLHSENKKRLGKNGNFCTLNHGTLSFPLISRNGAVLKAKKSISFEEYKYPISKVLKQAKLNDREKSNLKELLLITRQLIKTFKLPDDVLKVEKAAKQHGIKIGFTDTIKIFLRGISD